MQVSFDENGYAYDLSTGYYVSICYDEAGNAYECSSGAPIDLVDDGGNQLPAQISANIRDTLIGIFGHQGYPGQGQYTRFPNGAPQGVAVSGSLNRGGISTGINLSPTTLMLIAGGILLFYMGQQKGGRR